MAMISYMAAPETTCSTAPTETIPSAAATVTTRSTAATVSTFWTVAPATTSSMETTATTGPSAARSEEHTSELLSLMRISYAVFCLKKKKTNTIIITQQYNHTNIVNTYTH